MKINSEKKTLIKQIIIEAIACLLLIFVVFYVLRTQLRTEMEKKGINGLYEAGKLINSYIQESSDILYLISANVDEKLDKGADNGEILEYLTRCYEEYCPAVNISFSDVYGYVNGEFLDGTGWKPGIEFDPLQRGWYIQAMENPGENIITNPYLDARTGGIMIGFSRALKNGRGVISADVMLDWLQNMSKDLQSGGIDRFYLVDKNGQIIVYIDGNLKSTGEKTDQEEQDRAQKIVNAVLSENKELMEYNDNGRKQMIFNSSLIGGMSAVLVMNEQEYGKNIMGYVFSVSALVLLITALVIAFTIDRYKKNLKTIDLQLQLESAATIYESMHVVNSDENSSYELKCSEDIRSIVGDKSYDAQGSLQRFVNEYVDENNKETMTAFLDLKTLEVRMRDKKTITAEFLSRDAKWKRARFIRIKGGDLHRNHNSYMIAVENINEEKKRENQLRYMSEMDGLTGINNRISGERSVRDLMMKKPGLFLLLDVDKFKSINDTYGHGMGDKVIITVANTLKDSFRERDIVFRLGGDEFAVFAVGVRDEAIARNIIDRFFEKLNAIVIEGMEERRIAASMGGTFVSPAEKQSFENIYERADSGLYISKEIEGSYLTIIG